MSLRNVTQNNVIHKLGEYIHIFKEVGTGMGKFQTNPNRRQRKLTQPEWWDQECDRLNKTITES